MGNLKTTCDTFTVEKYKILLLGFRYQTKTDIFWVVSLLKRICNMRIEVSV